MPTQKHFNLIAFALLIALISGSCKPSEGNKADLAGEWKIIGSESDMPASPGYDDSAAETVMIPGSWDRFTQGNEELASTVWIRKKIIVEKKNSDRLMVLSLGPIALVDEAYFNGAYIGGTGRMPAKNSPLDYTFALHKNRTYIFPSTLVRYDKENVIAIKIFSHYINGIKESPKLLTVADWTKQNLYAEYMPYFNNLSPILLSILLMFFLGIITQRRWKDRQFSILLALIFTFIISIFFINLLFLGIPDLENNLYRFKLLFLIYGFADYLLMLIIQQFFNIKNRAVTIIFTGLILIYGILVAYAPTTRFLVSYGSNSMVSLVSLIILNNTVIFIIALVRDPCRYWYLSIVALFIMISVTDMLYTIVTGQLYKISFSFALRLPALLLGAIFVYLFDLKNIEKERDSAFLALMKKTKQLQRMTKLASRHDVKPEPRDVIHTLIDYLDTNYNESYDRVQLAKKFGLNDVYMVQLFKKTTSTNIANYINIKRIEAAKYLLRDTDSKVIDIAFHVGFDNLTYFYRHFKKQTGYSPIEYKRMMRNKVIDMEETSESEY